MQHLTDEDQRNVLEAVESTVIANPVSVDEVIEMIQLFGYLNLNGMTIDTLKQLIANETAINPFNRRDG